MVMSGRAKVKAVSTSWEVRDRLIEALNLDLVGPRADHPLADECLPGWIRPSNWYLTGFLIPSRSGAEQSADSDEDDDMDVEVPESAGLAEESKEERKAAKKGYFPSSMGLSFLMPKEEDALEVTVSWGDYEPVKLEDDDGRSVWQRTPRLQKLPLKLGDEDAGGRDVPESGGLVLHVVQREVLAENLEEHIPPGTRSVSVFLVNNRPPADSSADCAYVFQPELQVLGRRPFIPRPDLRGTRAVRWDDQVADLHYADTPSYATGHGVSADWEILDGDCRLLRTAWIPRAEVEKTVTAEVPGVELAMEALGSLPDGAAAESALRPLVEQYRAWVQASSPLKKARMREGPMSLRTGPLLD